MLQLLLYELDQLMLLSYKKLSLNHFIEIKKSGAPQPSKAICETFSPAKVSNSSRIATV
jgi:hypothetical protein